MRNCKVVKHKSIIYYLWLVNLLIFLVSKLLCRGPRIKRTPPDVCAQQRGQTFFKLFVFQYLILKSRYTSSLIVRSSWYDTKYIENDLVSVTVKNRAIDRYVPNRIVDTVDEIVRPFKNLNLMAPRQVEQLEPSIALETKTLKVVPIGSVRAPRDE